MNFEIKPKCFGKDTVKYIYYIGDEIKNFEILNIIDLMGLFYNIYFMFDYNC